MTLSDALNEAFISFYSTLISDGSEDILDLPYPQYTLQCWALYKDALFCGLLQENQQTAQALRSIGITERSEQLLVFIDAFFLSSHSRDIVPCAKTAAS